jgi:murein DD-endopeptidase MepM/ murein hydrolase activator NlpD
VLSSIAHPQGPPLALSATLDHAGWNVHLHLHEPARRIEYRTSTRAPFASTGEDRAKRDPDTLEPIAKTSFVLPDTAKKTPIEVRFVDGTGAMRGPYYVLFDPVAEAIADARADLEQPARRWASVTRAPNRKIYLTSLFAHKMALRAIHYGIDVARPDKKIPILPNADGKMEASDESEFAVGESARSVVLELEYRDGTRSKPRTFQLDQIVGGGGIIVGGRPVL